MAQEKTRLEVLKEKSTSLSEQGRPMIEKERVELEKLSTQEYLESIKSSLFDLENFIASARLKVDEDTQKITPSEVSKNNLTEVEIKKIQDSIDISKEMIAIQDDVVSDLKKLLV